MPGYGLLAARRLLREFGKHPETLFKYSGHVTAHFVRITELITCLVVQIRDIGIVAHVIIKLYHRVFRQYYLQLGIFITVTLYIDIFQIPGQTNLANQSGVDVVVRAG